MLRGGCCSIRRTGAAQQPLASMHGAARRAKSGDKSGCCGYRPAIPRHPSGSEKFQMQDFTGKTLMITGRDRFFRVHDPEDLPVPADRRDPNLQQGREETGRPADPLRGPTAQISYRRRSRFPHARHGDARGRLHLSRGGAEAGAELRVPPDGGSQHQRHGHQQRARRGNPQRRQPGCLASRPTRRSIRSTPWASPRR